MAPRPVTFRLVVTVALTTLVVVAVCGAAIHWAGRQAVYDQQVADLDRVTQLVQRSVTTGPAEEIGDADRARLKELAGVLDLRLTLIDGDGGVRFDSDATANLMDNHNDRPEVVAARTQGQGDVARRSHTLDEWSVYVARLLDPAKPDGVVVRVSQWRHPAPGLVTSLLAVAGAAAVSGLGAGFALWLMLRKQWVVPLRNLRDSARSMAAGDWERRVPPAGAEEVRALAGELNEVADAARRQSSELLSHRANVRSLADTLPDSVVVTDADDRITLLNTSAAELFGVETDRALGQHLANVIGDETLLQLIESVRLPVGAEGSAASAPPALTSTPPPREVRIVREGQHRTYQAHVQRTAGGGALLVLRDVSTLSGTVQMKADFVANASHELRTPIAAIKIAFETLRDVYQEDTDQADRCLKIIDGHMNRLEEMLRDLLDLSRVESAEMKPHFRELISTELFATLRAALGPFARQKLVELVFDDEEPVGFAGDERLLNLVLKNLIENSIKFTPPGGSVTLRVARKEEPGDVAITVSDTGVGIPPEHQDRVFERFYQVDPARSGSAGRGTGLGLAIVKHAVHAMGGTVQLRSSPGRGTVVTFTVPQNAAKIAAAASAP
jgi:two-component system phosphate regulon sensor histidine kinase PhoR